MKKSLLFSFCCALLPQLLSAQIGVIPESVRETPVVRAVRKVRDSVVSIETRERVRSYWGWVTKPGSGSGVIIEQEGLVVTNYHVIAGLERNPNARILIKTNYREEPFKARVTAYSDKKDIAVLKIENPGKIRFKAILRGHSDKLMIGETVIAIGNPFNQSHTVTTGVLSAMNRSVQIKEPKTGKIFTFSDLLQTDAAINPGNSGGALVDLTGKLIGINNAIRSNSEGIGYAIPIDTVVKVLEQLLDIDKGGSHWLGMETSFGDGVVKITSTIKGGPADRCGLRVGDQVIMVGEREVKTRKDYNLGFFSSVKDMKAHFTVNRKGKKFRMLVKAGTRVDKYFYKHAGMEVESRKLSRETLGLLQNVAQIPLSHGTGVMVTRIYPGRVAEKAGLHEGDFLVAFKQEHPFFGLQEVQLTHLTQLLRLSAKAEGGNVFQFMISRGGELFRGKLKFE